MSLSHVRCVDHCGGTDKSPFLSNPTPPSRPLVSVHSPENPSVSTLPGPSDNSIWRNTRISLKNNFSSSILSTGTLTTPISVTPLVFLIETYGDTGGDVGRGEWVWGLSGTSPRSFVYNFCDRGQVREVDSLLRKLQGPLRYWTCSSVIRPLSSRQRWFGNSPKNLKNLNSVILVQDNEKREKETNN